MLQLPASGQGASKEKALTNIVRITKAGRPALFHDWPHAPKCARPWFRDRSVGRWSTPTNRQTSAQFEQTIQDVDRLREVVEVFRRSIDPRGSIAGFRASNLATMFGLPENASGGSGCSRRKSRSITSLASSFHGGDILRV